MKTIRITKNPQQNFTVAAVLQDGELDELFFIDGAERPSVGNIYLGIVRDILPNQFAFVDIGYLDNAFLQLNDPKEKLLRNDENRLGVKKGDRLIVQVTKEPGGFKSECVTTEVAVHGQYAVIYRSKEKRINISSRISGERERNRLKLAGDRLEIGNHSVIFRTLARDADENILAAECKRLNDELCELVSKADMRKQPGLLFKRDKLDELLKEILPEVDRVIVSSELLKQRVDMLCSTLSLTVKCELGGESSYLEHEIEKLTRKQVWLKSGGFLLIEETEAAVVIDVNSGKFAGKKNHEESMLALNLEAAKEIYRQIILRNLGGMIIVDFASLKSADNINKLKKELSALLSKDRYHASIEDFTRSCLVHITRRKTKTLNEILNGNNDNKNIQADTPPRRLVLKKSYNTRELGGYCVNSSNHNVTKYKSMLRSGKLDQCGLDDIQTIADYGVRVFIDLRDEVEIKKDSVFAGYHEGIMKYNLPIMDFEGICRYGISEISDFPEFYVALLGNHVEIKEIFRTIARHYRECVMVNCSAGKDRTGIICCIMLMCAGVGKLDIVADYEISYTLQQPLLTDFFTEKPDLPRYVVMSEREWISGLYDYIIETYGSAEGYLAVIGLTEDEIYRVKNKLL